MRETFITDSKSQGGDTSKVSPKKSEQTLAKKDKGKKTIEKSKAQIKHGIEAMTTQ